MPTQPHPIFSSTANGKVQGGGERDQDKGILKGRFGRHELQFMHILNCICVLKVGTLIRHLDNRSTFCYPEIQCSKKSEYPSLSAKGIC